MSVTADDQSESQENKKYLTNQEMFNWIREWVDEEQDPLILGVLATIDKDNIPYTRTVAIREITTKGVLFFTQKGSKKVEHIKSNNSVSITVLLSGKKRQITFRGIVEPISQGENSLYWESYPKRSQVRFMVYGPKSGEVVANNDLLDQELVEVQDIYKADMPERPETYVGYIIRPKTIDFYQLNQDRISDSYISMKEDSKWVLQRVVP